MSKIRFIETQKVNCQDCHRCVRYCPVKAIGIQHGHAQVLDEKCVLCGKCVLECPQHAKQPMSQLDAIRQALAAGRRVVGSLAPSFVASFDDYTPATLAACLRALGFFAVEETAVGAEVVSQMYCSQMEQTHKTVISACCPVVVEVLNKYYPALVEYLAPVVSPMVAHGKIMKRTYGEEVFVVFIGPCIGKFAEGAHYPEAIDAVLSFEELRDWLEQAALPAAVKEQAACSTVPSGKARYFPIAGGILKSFMEYTVTDTEVIAVDGIERCMEVFQALSRQEIAPRFVEALACQGGCVNGPLHGRRTCTPARRTKVIGFAKTNDQAALPNVPREIDFQREHVATPLIEVMPNDEEIAEILRQMAKHSPLDEKNCGACGYDSCRAKAVAIFQGHAEVGMCVPYMRSKAESFAGIIVDYSINGIIVVDANMVVQEFNPAAEKMFNLKKDLVKGRQLGEFINCADFAAAARSGYTIAGKRVEYPVYGIVTQQQFIQVPQHGLTIGIFIDVTTEEKHARDMAVMKIHTIEKVTEVINKQMHVAQEIAGLLGETTAETKAALLELVHAVKTKGEG